MKDDKTYKTTNFHIASWFLMNDIELLSVDWGERRRAEFVFADFKEREQLVNNFFKEEILQKKISADQELKARMYANNSPEVYDKHK
jgi:hypothetical protein